MKEIIQNIEILNQQETLSFKISPKNSNFIIGSNDAVNRGKVIRFNMN